MFSFRGSLLCVNSFAALLRVLLERSIGAHVANTLFQTIMEVSVTMRHFQEDCESLVSFHDGWKKKVVAGTRGHCIVNTYQFLDCNASSLNHISIRFQLKTMIN